MVDFSKLSDEELFTMAGAKPVERESFLDAALDAPGRAGRMLAGGAGSVIGLAADPVGDVIEYATGAEMPGARDTLLGLYDRLTGESYAPRNEAERIAQTAGEFITGGGVVGGAAKLANAPAAIQSALATKTGTELASAGAGGAAFGAAQEAGLSPAAQMAVTLGASAVPFGAAGAGRAMLPKTSREAVNAQLASGGNVTVGGVLGGNIAPRVEAGLAQAPIVGGAIRSAREAVSESLAKRLDDIADAASPNAISALDDAGQAIRSSVTNAAKARIERAAGLYDDVFAKIPEDVVADTASSRALLNSLKDKYRFNNKALNIINDDTLDALTKGNIPARELKMMRPQLKDLADSAAKKEGLGSLAKDLNRIYVQVNDDIKQTASKVVKGADAEIANADAKFKAALDLDTRLAKWIGNKSDEALATAFKKLGGSGTAKTAAGANVRALEDIAEVLPKEQLSDLSSYMLRTMGRNSDGALNPVAFANEYLALNPKARALLFDKTLGKEQGNALKKIVDYAASSKTSLNPSGTAASGLDVLNIGYGAYSLSGAGGASLGLALAPYLMSKGMASQTFAKMINRLPRAALDKPLSNFKSTQLRNLLISKGASENDVDMFQEFLGDPNAFIMDTDRTDMGAGNESGGVGDSGAGIDYQSLSDEELFNLLGQPHLEPLPELERTFEPLSYQSIEEPMGREVLGLPANIKQSEGLELTAYDDPIKGAKARTVGYGFNMSSPSAKKLWKKAGIGKNFAKVYKGQESITLEEAEALGRASYEVAYDDALSLFPDLPEMSKPRREALVDLSYQLGRDNLEEFRKMRAAIKNNRWMLAAQELLNSRYADQVPSRARENARKLLRG